MSNRRRRRAAPPVAALVGGVLALTMGGGVAYAVWSASGSGAGGATAGTSTPLAVTAGSAPTSLLVPGGQADVRLVITNNNTANVSVTALTFSNTAVAGYTTAALTTPKSGCTTTGVTWVAATRTLSTPVVVAGGGGTYTLTLANAAQMSAASDDGCQSAFFSMPVSGVTASLTSAAASSPTSGTQ